jgi:hypothetical protein
MTPIDGRLDALLDTADEALPDDGFTAAVMRRVQAEQSHRAAPTLDAAAALARLDQRATRSRHERRWHWGGVAAGSAVALLAMQASGATPPVLDALQTMAMLAGVFTAAWVLATQALQER